MRLLEILQEAQNCLQITDLDWFGISGTPLQMSADVPILQRKFEERWPGVKFEVAKWDGPNDVPLLTVWGPVRSMEAFLLYYAGNDPDDADDLLAMCEKIVK